MPTDSFLVVSGLLLVVAWLVPNHYPPWLSAHSELMASISVAVLGLRMFRRPGIGRSCELPAPTVFFAILATVPLIQFAFGQIRFAGDAWLAFLYLICTAATTSWFPAREKHLRGQSVAVFAWTLVAGATLSAIVSIIQQIKAPVGWLALYIASVPPGGPPFANLAQPNLLATLLMLGLSGLWVLFETRCITGTTALVLTGPILASGIMTQSRTPLLMFGVAIAWHAVLARRIGARTKTRGMVVLAGLWAAGFFAWPALVKSFGDPVLRSTASRLEMGPRLIIWPQMIDAALAHPFFGFGWNQISTAQIGVATEFARTRYIEDAHNIVLDMVLWNGFPLAILILGIGTWWLISRARRICDREAAFALLVILLLLTHAMVEFPLAYLFFLVPFACAIAILDTARPHWPVIRIPGILGRIGAALFCACIVVAAVDYWRVEDQFRQVRFAASRIGRSNEVVPDFRTEFTQIAALAKFSLTKPRVGMTTQELHWMKDVAHRYAISPALYRYALAQALNGDLDGARLTLCQMRSLHGDRPYTEAREELTRFAATIYPQLAPLVGQL